MATYLIGDLQGCLDPLKRLLKAISFAPESDKIWFAGDLVSRGPDSLDTLRFVKQLGQSAIVVLGNHDLSLIAAFYGAIKPHKSVRSILHAKDGKDLINWLRKQPLLYCDDVLACSMCHAGIYPLWDLDQARREAQFAQEILSGDTITEAMVNMYGSKPRKWRAKLDPNDRFRFACNAFTRMRYVDNKGKLDFKQKLGPESTTTDMPLWPWFDAPNRVKLPHQICFGHWSTLGFLAREDILSVDTGCVWHGCLTAVQLDHPDKPVTQVHCDG